MDGINIWAILVASLVAFAIGSLWYSPILFANPWMKALKLSQEELASTNMAKTFGLAYVTSLVMAFCLAAFLNDPSIGFQEGVFYGFLTGFGFVAMSMGMTYLFSRQSLTLFLIDAGYQIVLYTVMGGILGAWK